MKPLVKYTMYRKNDDKDLYKDLASFIEHAPYLGIDVKSIQFFADGSVELSVLGAIEPKQLKHVGIEPSSERKL